MWTEVNNRGDRSGYRIPHPSRGGGRGQLRIDGAGAAHRGTFKKHHLQIGGAQKQPQTHFHALSHNPPKKKKPFQNRRRKNHQCCVRMWRHWGGNTLTSWCVNRLSHRGFILSTTICRDSLPRQHGHSDMEESGMRRWDVCGQPGQREWAPFRWTVPTSCRPAWHYSSHASPLWRQGRLEQRVHNAAVWVYRKDLK